MSLDLSGAAVIEKPIGALRPNPRNARRHAKRQIKLIADSIKAFGFVNPILVDETDMVLAGHGRLEAAKLLKRDHVPTLCITGLSDAQKRAYVLADNKLAEAAGWDRGMLATELGELAILLPTLTIDWNVEITGFALGEIDALISDQAENRAEPEDRLPQPRAARVTRPGDLWQLGPHRLLCGDARTPADLERLMRSERARMIFTDPPYNVPIQGHVTRSARNGHSEFAMASGEMSAAEFEGFLEISLGNAAAFSLPGSVHFVCMDWRHIASLIAVGERLYETMLNLCVWNKTSPGQGSFYRSQHELIGVFRVAGAPHQNNVELGRFGRNRSNVWTYPGANSYGRDRAKTLAMHPTVKPVTLVADAMRDCSTKNDIILDSFLGSGATLIAAEKTGRRCYGLEFDSGYVDVIIRRWQAYSGCDALLDGDGRTFDEIEVCRSSAAAPSAPLTPAEVI